mmetsp:Transcript_2394/g.5691  ORF Transcript_2394/g.5691 Transcript_2394/m.5691 type:complete len:548 (-) Transcript_2394:270-1913(-)
MGSFASTRSRVESSPIKEEPPPNLRRVFSEAPITWSKGQLIGTGAFGKVFLGLNEENGCLMAVKEIDVDEHTGDNTLSDLKKEIKMMSVLEHPNIVQYMGFQEIMKESEHGESRSHVCYIFMEYVPGGSLSSLLKKFGRFNESLVRLYAEQLLQGLAYLHRNNIIHRDIKGANVLMDKEGRVKLADFGASKQLNAATTQKGDVHSLRGTPYYMAPEAIKQDSYGRKADIWSLGCTVLQMATGHHPWVENKFSNPAAAMLHIAMTSETPKIPDSVSPGLNHFCTQCLKRDPAARSSAQQLLLHAFITGSGVIPPLPATLPTTRERSTSDADQTLSHAPAPALQPRDQRANSVGSNSVGEVSLGEIVSDLDRGLRAVGHYTGEPDATEADESEEMVSACDVWGETLDAGTVKLWAQVVAAETTSVHMQGLPRDSATGDEEGDAGGLRSQWLQREMQLRRLAATKQYVPSSTDPSVFASGMQQSTDSAVFASVAQVPSGARAAAAKPGGLLPSMSTGPGGLLPPLSSAPGKAKVACAGEASPSTPQDDRS